MRKWRKKDWDSSKFRKRHKKLLPSDKVMDSLFDHMGAEKGFELSRLWRNWEDVLGPQLSRMARPLKHYSTTLVLGGDDPIAMQELSYFSDEILKKINSYLGKDFFDKVHFDLIGNRVPLDELPDSKPAPVRHEIKSPENLGGLIGILDENTVVGKSYIAYVKAMKNK